MLDVLRVRDAKHNAMNWSMLIIIGIPVFAIWRMSPSRWSLMIYVICELFLIARFIYALRKNKVETYNDLWWSAFGVLITVILTATLL